LPGARYHISNVNGYGRYQHLARAITQKSLLPEPGASIATAILIGPFLSKSPTTANLAALPNVLQSISAPSG
jgi:hypothetical protein